MANARTPLLARERAGSEHSEQRAAEEDAALQGGNAAPTQSNGDTAWRRRLWETFLFAWALLATAGLLVLAVWTQHRQQTSHSPSSSPPTTDYRTSASSAIGGKRNLIFMVSDGMGPASLSLTRSFRQRLYNLEPDDTLALDRHFWGTSRTRATNSLVTDSAAGATAFACGRKSYNGAIAMLPDHGPCGTVLEAAARAGYATGLVVTTDLTDATPACFAAHTHWRVQMDEIALHEVGAGPLGRTVDLMLGGGRCHFLPNTSADSCRQDDVDVVGLARNKYGWHYADDRAGFDAMRGGANMSLPMLGLFARGDIPFELDRQNQWDVYPSLSEMARTALTALQKATADSDKGFFLMIEGSRIDHAGHYNDPAAQVHEVLEYDKTFQAVLDFLDASDVEGVLVATSDHETGGLATAWQSADELPVYNWHPSQLAKANASAEYLARQLAQHLATQPGESRADLRAWIEAQLVVGGLGITNARAIELDAVLHAAADTSDPQHAAGAALYALAGMVSRRARVGWSTHGHSAVDVNVYSSGGPAADKIRGNVENTQIGEFLADYLRVDVQAITRELRDKMDDAQVPSRPAFRAEAEGERAWWIDF